jgi:hypothetical protein
MRDWTSKSSHLRGIVFLDQAAGLAFAAKTSISVVELWEKVGES